MAQYDIHLMQNTSPTAVEFTEKIVNVTRGGLITTNGTNNPVVLAAGLSGQVLTVNGSGDLEWSSTSSHTQNTDTGTTNTTFHIGSDDTPVGPKLKNESGALGIRNSDDTAYANLTANNIVCNDLTVNGTTTTINATTLTVDDKNIELGAVGTPSDTTAEGGGITLKGTTDKNIYWGSDINSWKMNCNLNLDNGFAYYINGVTVLTSTQVLGKTLGTMASENAIDYVPKSLFAADSLLIGNSSGTVEAINIPVGTLVGRTSSGTVKPLTSQEAMSILWTSAPAAPNSVGAQGSIAYDSNYFYICVATNSWVRTPVATVWA